MPRSIQLDNGLVQTYFEVYDETNAPVNGLLDAAFTKLIFQNGVVSGVVVTVTFIANGVYGATFTPTVTGAWQLVIRNATYAPRGFEETFDVTDTGPDPFTRVIDGFTFFQEMELIGAVLCGKVSGGPATPAFRSMDNLATRVTAICDAVGNRTTVTLTP